MIGFKLNVLLTRLADKVLNKIGIHTAISKRDFFNSVFKTTIVIKPDNNQSYIVPEAFRFCNKISRTCNKSSPTCKQIITKIIEKLCLQNLQNVKYVTTL